MEEKVQKDKAFEDLQDRMVERFEEFSNPESKLYPFYLFGIGKMDYKDALDQITNNFIKGEK